MMNLESEDNNYNNKIAHQQSPYPPTLLHCRNVHIDHHHQQQSSIEN